MDAIADHQSNKFPEEFCIVGSTLRSFENRYKLALIRNVRPRIVVMGSSRVQQFRPSFFNTTFINASRTMETLGQGHQFIREMVKTHKPELVLLGIDVWWFNDREKNLSTFSPRSDEYSIRPFDLLKPYLWLMDGRIKLSLFSSVLLGSNKANGNCDIGVRALTRKDGFGPFGSRYYTSLIVGDDKSNSHSKFKNFLSQMDRGIRRFQYFRTVNNQRFREFVDLVTFLKSQNIKTIFFIPPMARPLLTKIQTMGDKYGYIDDLFNRLRLASIAAANFHDPSTISSPDCEFLDGYHAGDITAARMLRRMANSSPDLAALVNRRHLESVISKYHGLAQIPNARVTKRPEVDFLRIGCNKR